MKFRDLLENSKSITFFDIDETLFSTHAMIYVIKDNKIIKKLSNIEFNTYSLNDGETFDFSEFKDSELFSKTSEPIKSIIAKLNVMFKNISSAGSDMYLLTARADFDNKEKFINFLNSYNIKAGHINDGKIHVIRAGNRSGKDAADRKKNIIDEFLVTNKYSKVRLYDDSKSNLDAFLDLKNKYTNIKFEAYLITHGKSTIYK